MFDIKVLDEPESANKTPYDAELSAFLIILVTPIPAPTISKLDFNVITASQRIASPGKVTLLFESTAF